MLLFIFIFISNELVMASAILIFFSVYLYRAAASKINEFIKTLCQYSCYKMHFRKFCSNFSYGMVLSSVFYCFYAYYIHVSLPDIKVLSFSFDYYSFFFCVK